ncbi:MAG: O-antigen ligase family protein [Alphaproteobacteria bacterium]
MKSQSAPRPLVVRLLPIVAFAVVAASAAAFGSMTPLMGLVWATVLAVCGGGAAWVLAQRDKPIPSPLGICIALGLAMVVWGFVQVAPLPHGLEGWAHPVWAKTAQTLGGAAPATISLAPADTVANALLGMGYVGWVVVMIVLATRASGMALLQAMAVAATAVCMYGLAVYATGNSHVLNIPKSVYGDSLSATFINRNTFATFAGLAVLLNLAMLLERFGEMPPWPTTPWRTWVRALNHMVIKPRWPWLVATGVVMVALVLSNSRAGVGFSGLAVLVMVLVLTARQGWVVRGSLLVLVCGGAMATYATLGGQLAQRLQHADTDVGARQTIYATTLDAWHHTPWTGVGMGGFEEAFRMERGPELSLSVDMRIDHAHNTPLEWLLEAGTVGAGLMVAMVLAVVRALVQAARKRRKRIVYPSLGLGVLALVIGHSMLDFSLESPAVALLVLGALTVVLVKVDKPDVEQPLKPFQRALWACVAVGMVVAGGMAAPRLLQEAREAPVVDALNSLRVQAAATRKPIPMAALKVMEGKLSELPSTPRTLREQAMVQVELAKVTRANVAQAQTHWNMARTAARSALEHYPADPFTWHRLALAERALRNGSGAITAETMSLVTGPWEPRVAIGRLPLLASLYNSMNPTQQADTDARVLRLFQTGPHQVWFPYRSNMGVLAFVARRIQPDPAAVDEFEKRTWNKITPFLEKYGKEVP